MANNGVKVKVSADGGQRTVTTLLGWVAHWYTKAPKIIPEHKIERKTRPSARG